MKDIRDLVFGGICDEIFTAKLISEGEGILSGADEAIAKARQLGLEILTAPVEGEHLYPGKSFMTFHGTAKQIAMAEDLIIGLLAKPSGIATAAKRFVDAADGKFDIVCGSWKKVNSAVKESYCKAIRTGGCRSRMIDESMVYIDKNYVIMLGGVDEALEAVKKAPELQEHKTVVQIKGILRGLGEECWLAADSGADYIYVDTGKIDDLDVLTDAIQYMRTVPKLVFGGNVKLSDIERLKKYPLDVVGVGKAIIDAPMLDMKLNVVPKPHKCDHHHEK